MAVDSVTFLPQVDWDPPQVSPAPGGLFAAASWSEQGDGPYRWLGDGGVQVRTINYGFEDNVDVWTEEPCELDPAQSKNYHDRPEYLDAFKPITVFASDGCGLRQINQFEAKRNASAWLARQAPVKVAAAFGARMFSDVTSTPAVADIVAAVSKLEVELARTNTLGFIHASPAYAADAAFHQLLIRQGSTLRTPLGHTWVFDGGYVDALGSGMIATSQVYGWRGSEQQKTAWDHRTNQFIAVSEQSFLLGYEDVIAAVTIS